MLPGYSIVSELHRGRHRVVYRSRRDSDSQPVIIKTILKELAAPTDVAQLKREYSIMRSLEIAGIPKIHAFESHENCPFLIFEDVGGSTLKALIRSKSLRLDTILSITSKLATILAELHREGIVHRDINPKNILYDPESENVVLIDFGIASRLIQDGQKVSHPNLLEGTLAYISPEQTGRMNRAVDSRTDLYSLGVTLYEMLTGELPFASLEPLELVHAHLARVPISPHERNPEIPEVLSSIVMKLLNKTAEERYQSAFGLKSDLEICLSAIRSKKKIPSFSVGQKDFSDRFYIPQKLYGRTEEIAALMTAFERASVGPTELMLVSGYSGIGKSALVNEVHKPIVRQQGYFITGKFDQYKRDIPHSALIQAFQELTGQLLMEDEARITSWREAILKAVGTNAQVMIQVIPEVEMITGPQPPVPQLAPAESENRFNLVFKRFIEVFAQPTHPLVIFLDDLQWADSTTLKLLTNLLTDPDIRYLFVIGAYRDNEVNVAHPLLLTIADIEKAATATVQKILLTPLSREHVTQLLADGLKCTAEMALPLSELVIQKTAGNPFFIIQFLKSLHQDSLIEFDQNTRQWRFDLTQIRQAQITDNVVSLMADRIRKLSGETQHLTRLAACIGNQFALDTLAIVSQNGPAETMKALQDAVKQGLILPISDSGMLVTELSDEDIIETLADARFRFLHDRIEQAAYELIPAEEKAEVHLKVGRLLYENSTPQQLEDRLFDIVTHLNRGSQLITNAAERMELARLNLRAGQKAKSSTAYKPALSYFQAGVNLLPTDGWLSLYELAFSLHRERAECEYLCGNLEDAERNSDFLLQQAKTNLEKAEIYNLKMIQYETRANYADAVTAGRRGLTLLGIRLPEDEQEKLAALSNELQLIQKKLGKRKIAALVNLPMMVDPERKMSLKLLVTSWSPTYIIGENLITRLISATIVRLSLEYGQTEESAYGYVTHAITVGPIHGDYGSAYEWGMLALNVNEQFQDQRLRAKINQQIHAHVNLWCRPLKSSMLFAEEACRSGLENGDFTYAGYGSFTGLWNTLLIHRDLEQYADDCLSSVALLKKIRMTGAADGVMPLLNWARALQGRTEDPLSFTDANFEEKTYVETYDGNPFYMTFFYGMKLYLYVFFAEYNKAFESIASLRQLAHNLDGTIWPVILNFLSALTLANQWSEADDETRGTWWVELERFRDFFAALAKSAPENYHHMHSLISAEMARVEKRQDDAMSLYEQAIQSAAENGFIQHEALANELYARFWLHNGNKDKIARLYFNEAYYAYSNWGAAAKLEQLRESYPDLLSAYEGEQRTYPSETTLAAHNLSTIGADVGMLDLNTVIKAAQTISGEVVLERLLQRLMKIVMENAAAETGALLLYKNGALVIEAVGHVERNEIAVSRQSAALQETDSSRLPLTVLNYVQRTHLHLVIADAESDSRVAKDPYVIQNKPKSILCTPVLNQGRFIGILYLENKLSADVFTANRIEMMQIICAQAAISLENARLYEEMATEIEERKHVEGMLRAISRGTAAVSSGDFFQPLVRHLSSALQVRTTFVTECVDPNQTHVRTLAFIEDGEMRENIEYDLTGTPCEKVIAGQVCTHPEKLEELFPKEIGYESYVGVPLHDSEERLLGHLAVLDDKPMSKVEDVLSILTIFAARAGVELQRKRAEEALQQALAEVEKLKNRLQEENIYLREEIKTERNFEEIIGQSAGIRKVTQRIKSVAATDSTVLIMGETGTGKELIAHALHNLSKRRDRPLIKVNCAALPAGLVESEFFGHEKGAFTGAIHRKLGRFELADGGSIFLDEIGDVPLEVQVKLLRVLQEQEFERVGGTETKKVNVRLITATNQDLTTAVNQKAFRADLYYRLNVFPIRVPPLRERKDDIALLVHYIINKFTVRLAKEIRSIDSETMNMLVEYDWPGNIRELSNVLERAMILSTGPVLKIEREAFFASGLDSPKVTIAESAALDDVERNHILKILEETRWVINGPRGAAQILGLHPNTLRNRMQKLGIHRQTHRIS